MTEISKVREAKGIKVMENFKLLKSEIKKVEKFASRMNGIPTQITGYFHKGYDNLGFITVKCEMCSHDMTQRESDVTLEVCTFDRRMSFVHP